MYYGKIAFGQSLLRKLAGVGRILNVGMGLMGGHQAVKKGIQVGKAQSNALDPRTQAFMAQQGVGQ
jgi:hypothetical protein